MRARFARIGAAVAALGWLAAITAVAAGWSREHIDVFGLLLAAAVSLSGVSASLWLAVTPREAFRLGHAAGQRDGRRRPLVRVPVVYLPDRRRQRAQVERDRRDGSDTGGYT